MDDWDRALLRASGRPGSSAYGPSRYRAGSGSFFSHLPVGELPPWLRVSSRPSGPVLDPSGFNFPGPWRPTAPLLPDRRLYSPWVRAGPVSSSARADASSPAGDGSTVGVGLADAVAKAMSQPHIPTHWSAGKFSSVREEKSVRCHKVADRLLRVAETFESSFGLSLGVRELAPDRASLLDLLVPRRPGTVERHLRLWARFDSFLRLDVKVSALMAM